eukprot:15431496-Alexandrium_andersonii.AAC.1
MGKTVRPLGGAQTVASSSRALVPDIFVHGVSYGRICSKLCVEEREPCRDSPQLSFRRRHANATC